MGDITPEAFERASSMEELFALLDKAQMKNGWAKPEPSMYPKPKQSLAPAHWPYRHAKPALDAAGRFVNTELAERRNLILANPVAGNTYPTVQTLVCAYQLVKAGEAARSHRHTANALRLVLDTAPGTYTIVEGEKIPMQPGDVLLTPNWLWHGHINESTRDAYWIDVLDVPLVHLLGPMFFEQHPDTVEQADCINPGSPHRFAWETTVAALSEADEIHTGVRQIELGRPAMASIALHVTRLDAASTWASQATTLNAVFAVMAGDARAETASGTFECARGDIIAIPSSCAVTWTTSEEAYLLRASDQPVLQSLDWLRPIASPE